MIAVRRHRRRRWRMSWEAFILLMIAALMTTLVCGGQALGLW